MKLLTRILLYAVGWLAIDPEPSGPHVNLNGDVCTGVMVNGDPCEPCDECQHALCMHDDPRCVECDREDGTCRS